MTGIMTAMMGGSPRLPPGTVDGRTTFVDHRSGMNPNRIVARYLTDEDLLSQFRASDGVCARAKELLTEIERRGLPY